MSGSPPGCVPGGVSGAVGARAGGVEGDGIGLVGDHPGTGGAVQEDQAVDVLEDGRVA
jgi:hypothetical protein